MPRTFQRSPLALAVLALLFEAPMHPYRMQQLIKERGKDQVINVQRRASLYQTINQLRRAGLIAVQETEREEHRPERTIYALTDKGYRTAQDWMRAMLSTPTEEFPEFPAAVSFLPLLAPDDALRQLEAREAALAEKVAGIDAELREAAELIPSFFGFERGETSETIPRLFLLEGEYLLATLNAELDWVRALIGDLRAGRLTWSEEWLRRIVPPEPGPDSE